MRPSILFFQNPGRQSRHYLLGLIRAARDLGLTHAVFDLGPAWHAVQTAGANADDAKASVAASIRKAAHAIRATHTLGYIANGIAECGLTTDSAGRACSTLAAEGVTHMLLWTDHPNWVAGGQYLQPQARELLAHTSCVHVVKSRAAAGEIAEVFRWSRVHAMPMAEDYAALQPARGIQPKFDVVAILGYAHKVPAVLTPFLTQDDPEPRAMDVAMQPAALAAWDRATAGVLTDAQARSALGEAWLDAKATDPARSFWHHTAALPAAHSDAIVRLREDPHLWYAGIHALQDMVRWRRDFWLCWLARRVSVGVFGTSAAAYGLPQRREQTAWVEYSQQSAVYAQGRLAININGMPDEEGLTHKPFQIAASGVPMVHHAVSELGDAFDDGREIVVFDRGSAMLDRVRSLLHDEAARKAMADAALARAKREHTWADRLTRMLNAGSGHASRAAA